MARRQIRAVGEILVFFGDVCIVRELRAGSGLFSKSCDTSLWAYIVAAQPAERAQWIPAEWEVLILGPGDRCGGRSCDEWAMVFAEQGLED